METVVLDNPIRAPAAASFSASAAPLPAPPLGAPLLSRCAGCLRALGLAPRAGGPGAVDPRTGLRRTLTTWDLFLIGVGGIIGAGVYVLSGVAAARYAGPAVMLSFVMSGVSCFFCALCYSELAALIPSAGSAYAFATAALGPRAGFFVGWCLILEYLFGAATVAAGWSGYLVSLFADMGATFDKSVSLAPVRRGDDGAWRSTGGGINLHAMNICLLATALQVRGARESATFNNVVVVVKVGVLLLFLASCIWFVNPKNYEPFVPPAANGRFGAGGVLQASSVVFFAYIGFDAVSTAAGEAINPQRSLPIAIVASLAVCTLLYILVALVLTGLVPYAQLDVGDPIAVAVNAAGPKLAWLRPIVKVGALLGLTSVICVLIMGQARILFAMAKDGLLPPFFMRVHPRFHTPYAATLLTGALAAALAAVFPVDALGEMVSIGTLVAFVFVCYGTLALRGSHPGLARPFRVPLAPWTPAAGALLSLVQIVALPSAAHWQLLAWAAIGAAVYFLYSEGRQRPWAARRDELLGLAPAAAEGPPRRDELLGGAPAAAEGPPPPPPARGGELRAPPPEAAPEKAAGGGGGSLEWM